MKLSKHFMLFLVFVIISILSVCTGPIIKNTKPVDCSILFEDAKKLLLDNKSSFLASQINKVENASFKFSKNHKCASEDAVIFAMLIDMRYFDGSIDKTLCVNVSLGVLAEIVNGEFVFTFDDMKLQSMELCKSTFKRDSIGWEGGIGQ